MSPVARRTGPDRGRLERTRVGDGVRHRILADDPVLRGHDGWFLDRLPEADDREPAGGRGAARFITLGGQPAVLRHYRRGGLVRHLVATRYLWLGAARSRAFREFRVLERLAVLGLPSPRPIAAELERCGPSYRALLVMHCIGGDTLASRLDDPVSETVWRAVGHGIARFHAVGLCHADLNAHNVLLDHTGDGEPRVSLIDFDRARLLTPPTTGTMSGWQRANLARLCRSLDRLRERKAGSAADTARDAAVSAARAASADRRRQEHALLHAGYREGIEASTRSA